MRAMLCEGCTPLSIIRHICDLHHEGGRWQSFVSDCFRQAFGVTLLALPDRYDSLLANRKIQDYLNTEILHEIISNRHLWVSSDMEYEVAHSWFSELSPTDIWSATDRFDPQAIPEIAAVWPHLDTVTRQYLRVLIVNAKVNYERSLILARLAERLQEKQSPSYSEDEDAE